MINGTNNTFIRVPMVRLYTAHNTNGVVNSWVYKEDNELFINTLVNMYILFNVDIYV